MRNDNKRKKTGKTRTTLFAVLSAVLIISTLGSSASAATFSNLSWFEYFFGVSAAQQTANDDGIAQSQNEEETRLGAKFAKYNQQKTGSDEQTANSSTVGNQQDVDGNNAIAAILVVDDNGVCPGAAFTTIQSAVDVANPGDTIQVCAGTYPETVTTNKNLIFRGPQAGIDARTGRADLTNEAIVGAATGAFSLQVSPGTTTIDGFTMTGAASANGDQGALLLLNGSGHQVVNNIIRNNQRAAGFGANGTVFRFNRISNNTTDALFLTNGDGDGSIIDQNLFESNESDLVTVPSAKADNLVVSNNTSVSSLNFTVLFNTTGAVIRDNVVNTPTGSVIFIGGGNTTLLITKNSIKNGTASAVNLTGGFGNPPDVDVSVIGNNFEANAIGVRFGTGGDGDTGTIVSFNRFRSNTDGIRSFSAQNVNAVNNFWGCNEGPSGGAGCDTINNTGTGIITANPYLVLTTTVSPALVPGGGTSTVTADLTKNSAGQTPAGGSIPAGIPVTFAAVSGGTVNPTTSTTQAGGFATTTFTADNMTATAVVRSTVDSASDDENITVDASAPTVLSVVRVGQSPTNATTVQFTVTFNETVTGVDINDFALTTSGSIVGAFISNVTPTSGFSTVYTVTVMLGNGSNGTLRLDVIDNNTINDNVGNNLGGPGAGNGGFNTGEAYTFDTIAPTVTINQAAGQNDPTSTTTSQSPVNFTVVFNEVVFGFTSSDIMVTGSAFGTGSNKTVVITDSGDGKTYNVAVSGMNATGTVIINFAAGAAQDAATNGSAAPTIIDNTVTFNLVVTPVTVTPVDLIGWFNFNDSNNQIVSPTLVEGPATPPLGIGSERLLTNPADGPNGRIFFATTQLAGTRLDQITALTYSTYTNNPGNLAKAPSLQFGVDFNLTDADNSFQGRVIFEPYQNGTVQQMVWQTWDANNGLFYTSRATINGSPTPCSQAVPCTRAQLLTAFPNIGIHANPGLGVIGFRGEGSSPTPSFPQIGFDGNVDAFTIGVNSANKTFDFEPTPPTVSIDAAATPLAQNEGVTANAPTPTTTAYNFVVRLSQPTTTTPVPVLTMVTVSTADGTATVADGDYTAVNTTLTFDPVAANDPNTDADNNPLTQTVTVTVNGDNKFEADEAFTLNLSNTVNAAVATGLGTRTGTITNDDPIPTVSISDPSNPATVTEGSTGTTTTADFTVSLSNPSSTPITVSVTAGGTATSGTDFTLSPTTLTFAAGETSKTVTATINGDVTDEPDETFTATIAVTSGAGTATVATGMGTGSGTIVDDDAAPVVSINSVTQNEGNSATTAFVFQVTLSNPSSTAITVNIATADGTATVADGDYTAVTTTLTFDPTTDANADGDNNPLTQNVTVNVNGDTKLEPTEAFTVTATQATVTPNQTSIGTGTITNDDTTPVVTITNAPSVTEGTPVGNPAKATFTINLSNASSQDITVQFSTANGTAVAPGDFAAVTNQTVTIPAGQTSTTVQVTVNDDIISEVNESFTGTISSPSGATLGAMTIGTATIVDNDGNGFVFIRGNIQQYVNATTTSNLGGVTVTLTKLVGTTTTTQTTMSDPVTGDYSFNGLQGGANYLVTPSLGTKQFEPSNRSYVNLVTNISNANFLAFDQNNIPRHVVAVTTLAVPSSGTVTVPFDLVNSQGNENGVSFTISYAAPLSNPVVSLAGTDSTGAALTSNTAIAGKVEVALVLPNGSSFAAGRRRLVNITFNVAATSAVNTPINFVGTPTANQVRNSTAGLLASVFDNGFVVYQQGLEADVVDTNFNRVPDNQVRLEDFQQIGAFVVRSEIPNSTTTNEFQRADCEPESTKGDGDVDLGDFQQAGAYAVGNGTPQTAGGAFQPLNPNPFAGTPLAQLGENIAAHDIRIVPKTGARGMQVTVPIEIESDGTEAGVSFTLNYDPAVLSVAGPSAVVLGDGAQGAFLVPSNTAVSGKIGVALTYFPGQTFQAGIRQVVRVTFNVAGTAPIGASPLTFSDDLAARQVRTSTMQLPATFNDGNVNIGAPSSASVGVSGRILDLSGRGLARARVTITDGDGSGRTVTSNPLGFFRFDNVTAGGTYVINVSAKQLTFDSQVINVTEEITNLTFAPGKAKQ